MYACNKNSSRTTKSEHWQLPRQKHLHTTFRIKNTKYAKVSNYCILIKPEISTLCDDLLKRSEIDVVNT